MGLLRKGLLKSFLNCILPNKILNNSFEIEKFKNLNLKGEIKEEFIEIIKEEIFKFEEIIKNQQAFDFKNDFSLKENIIDKINKIILNQEDKIILNNWLNRLGMKNKIKNFGILLLNEVDFKEKNLFKIPKRKSNYFSKNIKNKIIVIEGLEDEDEEENIEEIINIKKSNDLIQDDKKKNEIFLKNKIPNFKIDLPMEKIDEIVIKKKKKTSFNKNEKNRANDRKSLKASSERRMKKKSFNKDKSKNKNEEKKSKISKKLSRTPVKNKDDSVKKKKNIKSEKNSFEKNNQSSLEITNSDISEQSEMNLRNSQKFRRKKKKMSMDFNIPNLSKTFNKKSETKKFKKKNDQINIEIINKNLKNENKTKEIKNIAKNSKSPEGIIDKDKKNKKFEKETKNKNKKNETKNKKKSGTLNLYLKEEEKKSLIDKLKETPISKQKKKLKKLINNNIKFLNISLIKDPRIQRKSLLMNVNDKSDLDFQDMLKELDKKKTDKKILNDINLSSFLENNKKNNSFNLDEGNSNFEFNKYNSDKDINNYFEKNLKKNDQRVQERIFTKKAIPNKNEDNKLSKIENKEIELSEIQNEKKIQNSNIKKENENLNENKLIEDNKNDIEDQINQKKEKKNEINVEKINKDDKITKRSIKNYLFENKNKEIKNINEDVQKNSIPEINKKKLSTNGFEKDKIISFQVISKNKNNIKKKEIENFCILKSKNEKIISKKKKSINVESVNIFQRKIKEKPIKLKKKEKYKKIDIFNGIYIKNLKTLKISNILLKSNEKKRGTINYSLFINKKGDKKRENKINIKNEKDFEKEDIKYTRSKTVGVAQKKKIEITSEKDAISEKEKKLFQFKPKIIILNDNLPVKRRKDDKNFRKKLKKRKKQKKREEIKSMDIFLKKRANLKKTIHNKIENTKSITHMKRNYDHDETLLKGDLIKSEIYSFNDNNLSRKKKNSGLSLSRSWNITNPENFINHSKKSFDLSNDLANLNYRKKFSNCNKNFFNNNAKSVNLMKSKKLMKNYDKDNFSVLINMFKKIMIFNAKIEEYQKKILFDQNFSLLELFRLYDKNDNGIINFEDLKNFCYDMELKLSEKLLTVIIVYLNQKDKNNFLNFKAFSKLLYPCLEDKSNLFSEFFKIKNEFYKISQSHKKLIKNIIVLKLKMIEHISKSIKKITNFDLKGFYVYLTDSINNKIDWKILKIFLKENDIFFTENHLLYIFKEISGNNFCFIDLENFEYFWNFFNNFNKK